MGNESPKKGNCQKLCLKSLLDPDARVTAPPVAMRLKLQLTRRLSFRQKKMILRKLDRLTDFFRVITGQERIRPVTSAMTIPVLQAGDLVRVRSREEIDKTLDARGQLKGCAFMEEMGPYCGTSRKVLKPVRWFMDERDGSLKKANGIILLENVMCQGTRRFGPCDRSCHFFWRIEWLEKT